MQTYDFSVIWHLAAACDYSTRGRMGGMTRQARQIVTYQWNLITTLQLLTVVGTCLGVAIYWESGAVCGASRGWVYG